MDVARINFSHGDQQTHAETIRRIRALAAELDHPIAILGDLQGPKLRVGELPEAGVMLQAGERVLLSTDPDLFIDTTDVFDKKIAALRSHASQVAKRDEEFNLEKLLRDWGSRVASMGNMPEGRLAEGYRVVDTQ